MVEVEEIYRCGACGYEYDWEDEAQECCNGFFCLYCGEFFKEEENWRKHTKSCKERYEISQGVQKTLVPGGESQ